MTVVCVQSHVPSLITLSLLTVGIVHEELSKAFEKTKRGVRVALKSRDSRSSHQLTSHHQQQQNNIIMGFADRVSVEATPPETDLDDSMKHFQVSVNTVCLYICFFL